MKAKRELLVWYHRLYGKTPDADELKVIYKPKAAWSKGSAAESNEAPSKEAGTCITALLFTLSAASGAQKF